LLILSLKQLKKNRVKRERFYDENLLRINKNTCLS
jgi:hypothetical protein